MAKTRRRHSYRKSKRWNPKRSGSYYRAKRHLRGLSRAGRDRVIGCALGQMNPRRRRKGRRNPSRYQTEAQANAETVKYTRKSRNCGRNPGATFTKHLRGGGRVEVFQDGQVIVSDHGREYDRYIVSRGQIHNFINSVKNAGRLGVEDFRHDNHEMVDMGVSANPRRGRRKGRGRFKRGRNPAQFPMPFASAMNPRRRGRGKRRNPPISKRDARAMRRGIKAERRVLRRHGR